MSLTKHLGPCLGSVLLALLPGCYALGKVPVGNVSETELGEGNFTVVETGVRGEASCAYLFSLIPLGDPALSTLAVDDLVERADLRGQSRALVNYSIDATSRNFFFVYEERTVVVRADVVQFDE